MINAIYPNSFSHRLRDASSLSEGASSEEEKLSGMPKPPSLREGDRVSGGRSFSDGSYTFALLQLRLQGDGLGRGTVLDLPHQQLNALQ